CASACFFLVSQQPPILSLFPYTTLFRSSKVVGIALKDRGGILPAGHFADAAYWFEGKTGNWISSSFYMTDLPDWVKTFNAQKLRSEEHTSELQSRENLVCRLLLEKKKKS